MRMKTCFDKASRAGSIGRHSRRTSSRETGAFGGRINRLAGGVWASWKNPHMLCGAWGHARLLIDLIEVHNGPGPVFRWMATAASCINTRVSPISSCWDP